MLIQSFNVNGVRAAFKKGFREWMNQYGGDIIGLQETKAWVEQLSQEHLFVEKYEPLILSKPEKKGYSGVGFYTKIKESKITCPFFNNHFDAEGRVIQLKTSLFTLLNVYFPNGAASPERLQYKMNFYQAFLEKCQQMLKEGQNLIVMGDVNTAHQEIDLAHPRENEKKSGFLPIEREWISQFLKIGFVDSFRYLNPNVEKAYSWWDLKTAARQRNVGWRIDYIFLSEKLVPFLTEASILTEVMGSDHCPVQVRLNLSC